MPDLKAQQFMSENILDQKRFIGRKFTDPEVQTRLKYLPFKVINKDGKPTYEVVVNKDRKHYNSEEISAKLLSYLKDMASAYMGFEISHAVVTVPAYFNVSQREATKDACRIAGLNVLRIINEPTAAAYSIYESANFREYPYNILIYNLKSETFDVTIMRVESNSMKVLSTRSDNNLGGENFNSNLVAHFAEDIMKKLHFDVFALNAKEVLARLQARCEAAKIKLCLQEMFLLELCRLNEEISDYSAEFTRSKFEELNIALFWKTVEIIELCLSDAKLRNDQIKAVVVAGRSTRIPYLQNLLKDFFKHSGNNNINNIELINSQNPDESIAIGAAMYAKKLVMSANILKPPLEKRLVGVIPLSLGIEVDDGRMSVIISRNSSIPVSAKKIFSNHDFQTTLQISVYQGEYPFAKDNYDLGSFTLTGIPPKPKGSLDIEVTFKVKTEGVLVVSAMEFLSKTKNKLEFNFNERFNQSEIEDMIESAQLLRQNQIKDKEIENLKNKLQEVCLNISSKLKCCTLEVKIEEEIEEMCTIFSQEINTKKTMTQEQLERKLKTLRNTCVKHNIL